MRPSILFIILFVTATNGDLVIDSDKSETDYLEVAASLLEELNKLVENSISTTIPSLNLLSSEIVAISNSVLIPAKRSIQAHIDTINKAINDLRNECLQLGIDLVLLENCINGFRWQIANIQQQITSEIETCLNGTVSQGLDIINGNIEGIKNNLNSVTRIKTNLEICKLAPTEEVEKCAVELIESISIEMVDIPARIKEDGEKTRAVVRVLEGSLSTCAIDRVDSVLSLGMEYLRFIRNCAKMPPTI